MHNAILRGPIAPALRRLALPIFVGMVCVVSFQLADTYFVSALGELRLAAIGLIFPITMTVMHLGTGLDIGTTSTVARRLGAGDRAGARKLVVDALWLVVLLSLALSALGLATMDPLFRALGADDETLPLVKQYMTIWYAGLVLSTSPMVLAAAMRASGNTRTPGALQAGASLVNVLLDPLCIFGAAFVPAMGIAGAAVATLCARALYALALGWLLSSDGGLLSLRGYSPRGMLRSWKQNLAISVPASAGNIVSAGTAIITVSLVGRHGSALVGGVAVGMRAEALALITTLALAIAMAPFVGQNLGAGNFERIGRGLSWAYRACLVLGAGMWALLSAFGPQVAALFSDDPQVTAMTVTYLRWAGAAFAAQGVITVGTVSLNALGSPLHATALIVGRVLLVYAPLAWWAGRVAGVPGILGAFIACQAVFALLTVGVVERRLRAARGAAAPAPAPPASTPTPPAAVARAPRA